MEWGRPSASVVALAVVALGACTTTLTPLDDGTAADAGYDVGAASTCDARTRAASNAVQNAVAAAAADLSCAIDDDCTLAGNSTACSAGCGVLLNSAGAARVKAAIAELNASTCGAFEADGCRIIVPPCAPPQGGAACVSGQCASFPPAVWASFAVQKGPPGTPLSTPPSCPPSADCTLWSLTPDATLTVTGVTGTTTKRLSQSDFATVDGILKSLSFRQSELSGFNCPASPGTAFVSFTMERALGTSGHDVSGCALAGSTTSDARRLYDVLRTY